MKKARRTTRAKRTAPIKAFVITLIAVVALLVGGITFASADAGDVPEHGKTLTDNEDGTFQLELSVTGDADTEVQTAANVNVLVILDTSNSMTMYRANGGNTGPYRADAAEKVVYDFTQALFDYQDASNPTNIQMALVTFNTNGTTAQGWTSTESQITSRLSATGNTNSRRLNYSQGTNWERALRQANTVLGQADGDPTFVIFVTDGAPTQTATNTNINTNYVVNYRAATDESRTLELYQTGDSTEDNTTFFGIYAYGDEADYLDDLVYYSQNGSERTARAATDPTPNYYNASDTAALTDAIEDIFQTIVEALGVSSVAISDGTTHEVTTSTGEISELLEVDESSYQYWLSIPVVSNQFQRIDLVSGETVTYTVTDNGDGTCTVAWGSNSVTVNGSVSGGQFKYEWTEANALYNYAPPAAELKNGAVDWDLSPVGTLLDGVTYSVTFDVYPSQTTLDIVADIKNDPGADGAWGDLDPTIQQYIDVNGNLSTNTTATLTYTDTRTGQSGSSTYDNPDPVETSAVEQMAVSKQWENEIDDDGSEHDPITLTVTRDGVDTYDVTLSKDNTPTPWTDSVYISIGIMRTNDEGEMEVLEGSEGHDFTFAELGSEQYHWELDVPVVHPMMIDGTTTMLIKVDEKHPAPDGADTYTINGSEYYVDEEAVALTALNERRSRLFLTKEVTGENVPEDATFPFTINVVNSKAPDAEPADDPNHDSDYWVWISARDAEGNALEVEGATHDSGSWWYAPSGTDVTVHATAGCSIMVNNLPTGTTYTITEGDLPTGFVYDSTDIAVDGDGTGEPYELDRTTTGTIDETNTEYTLTYTNEYALVDVTVNKVWDDNSDQDGLRPDELELTLNGLPEGTTAPEPTITGTDGDTWTYTWSGLPKYDADGEAIEYTVTEDTVPEGYSCDETTVASGGTITNTHEASTIDITVTKEWDDADDQDGLRPDEVTVQLMVGEEVLDTQTLNEDNEWTYTWTGLDEKENGAAIEYDVLESPVPDGYEADIVKSETDTGYSFTVTNSHIPEKVEVKVTKQWDDADDQDGKRPDEITVNLFADGKLVDTVILSEENDWTYTWTKLDKNAGGEEIEYTVEEVEVPADYTSDGATGDPVVTEDAPDGALIVNIHVPEKTEVTIIKVWDDEDNRDGIRPTPQEFAAALTLTPAVEGATPNVVDNENGTYTATYTGLPKYEGGEEIDYVVTEDAIDGYSSEETTIEGLPAFINTHEPVTIDIDVTKVWDDEDDADGIRPETVTVQLLADGEPVEEAVILGEENSWSHTWEGLPQYKEGEQGVAIKYEVEEVEVPEGYEVSYSGDSESGFTITNKHTPKEPEPVISDPPIGKVVEGNPDEPSTFTFQMVALTEGAPMPEGASGGTMTVQITGSGSREFGEMYYYEPGTYVYELSEVDGGIEGYTYDTNKYTLTVTVELDDEGNLVKTEKVTDSSGNEVDFNNMVFTNKYEKETPPPKPDPKPDIPATGDPTGGALPVALLSLLGGGSAVISSRIRRRKDD